MQGDRLAFNVEPVLIVLVTRNDSEILIVNLALYSYTSSFKIYVFL